MKRLITLLTALVLTASLLAGCGGDTASQEDVPGTAPIKGSISVNGSTSMEKLIGILGEQFMADNSGVTLTYDPTGSGTGIEAAKNGSCDVGLSSRALKDQELSAGLTGTTVALDGIAIIVHRDNPVTDLTVEQIADLFTGTATDWSQVGGSATGVAPIGREAGSGTRDGFETVTDTKDDCRLSQELTSTGAVVEAVAGNPNAIGYASLAAVADKTTVRILTVDGVPCTEDTVMDGTYPVQRPFVLVTKEGTPLSAQAQAFVDFATSPAAGDLIRAAGAVPAGE